MEFFNAVEKRYTHKEGFLPNPVPLEILERIAKAGIAAPSGGNSQSVRLVILPDRSALQPLCDISPALALRTAPSAIALFTDSSTQSGVLNFELEDYAAAAENMLLAVAALGYASIWLDSPYFDGAKEKAARELLGAPECYRLRVVLPIGLPDGPGTRREKMPYSERVFYRRFGENLD
jgi:nitroreductase